MRLAIRSPIWLLVCLASGLSGCRSRGVYVDAPTYRPETSYPVTYVEIVNIGDAISVSVFGEEPLSVQNARVGPRGTLMLPLLGEVVVAGKEPAQVARELEKTLTAYVTTPHVTVTIEQSPVFITVIGESRANGRIEMEAPVRIVDALAQAGGLNEFADKSGIYVLRGNKRIRFEYEDIVRNERHARNFLMMSGDVLVVED